MEGHQVAALWAKNVRTLIVGCGYVGTALGAQLASAGHGVYGLRRSPAAADELSRTGIQPLTGDASCAADLARLPGAFDWVVNVVGASGSEEGDYRRAYVDTTKCLVEWLASHPPRKYVYTSSTAVYGQEDGAVVEETSPTQPKSPTGRVLVEVEQLLSVAASTRGLPAVTLRVAGIYGPGRTYWLKQFLGDKARLEGRGERIMNMIHRDDVVGCVCAALEQGRGGEVYNAVDDEPVSQWDYFQWLATALGKPWLPSAVCGEPPRSRTRGGNKRVSNRKLKVELGYRFKYSTFREGYTAEIARLRAAGDLADQRDPR